MKAPSFAYVRPGTVDDVVTELAEDGAKVIAGGQSLTPVLAMRLARPTTLVDINAVSELARLDAGVDTLTAGAIVRQRQVQTAQSSARVPLLRLALPWVGHRELRSRGTVCGSLAHADPSAELPAVACCLDAEVTVRGPRGRRTIAAGDLFTAAMTTSITPDEVITAVTFPYAKEHEGFGFAEVARRHGDFALAGVAIRVGADDPLRPSARLVAFGVADTPIARDVSAELTAAVQSEGSGIAEAELATRLGESARAVADAVVTTGGDEHASAAYRRQLVAALYARQLARAYGRATHHDRRQERTA